MSVVPCMQLLNITTSPLLGFIDTPISGKSVAPPASTSFKYASAVVILYPPTSIFFLPASVSLSNESK